MNSSELIKAVSDCSYVADTYSVTYKLCKPNKHDVIIESGTRYLPAIVDVVISRNTGELCKTSVLCLNIPDKDKKGYFIHNNNMNIVGKETQASGFSFYDTKDISNIKSMDSHPKIEVVTTNYRFKYLIGVENAKLCVSFKNKSIGLGVLLRALTGCSYSDLCNSLGIEHTVLIHSLKNEPSREVCIQDVCTALGAPIQGISDRYEWLLNRFLSPAYASFDASAFARLDSLTSYSMRAKGLNLAEDIKIIDVKDGKHTEITFSAGQVLSINELNILDHSHNLNSIVVTKNNRQYKLRKFYSPVFACIGDILDEDLGKIKKGTVLSLNELKYLDTLDRSEIRTIRDGKQCIVSRITGSTFMSIEHLYQAISILLDNLGGFGIIDVAYSIKSQKMTDVESDAVNKIKSNISIISENIVEGIRLLQDSESIFTIVPKLLNNLNPNILIDSIKNEDKRLLQQYSTMNIIAAYDADSKISKAAKHAAIGMVDVKDDQFGRTDPIDSPESNQIGKVNKLTFMSSTKNGEIKAPYYAVFNGVPDKSRLVELTAQEEAGKYIADFNETFTEMDSDGNKVKKKSILCRLDGTDTYTDIENVSYMVPSPFHDMSAARMQIPLQQNALPKRLLMATNHQKQATISIGREKAFVRSGGDSITLKGIVRAKDLVAELYDSLERGKDDALINSAVVKLNKVSSNISDSTRSFSFTIRLQNESHSIIKSYPFLERAENNVQISYLVNAKEGYEYSGDDVIIYPDSYNIDKNNLELHFDGGSYKAEDIDFNTSVSTGVNLFVGYKTHESTTIDDAITISSRLIGDDTLSTVELVEIKQEPIIVGSESSSFVNSSKDPLFTDNGLPVIGRWVRPNDPIILMRVPKKDKDGQVTSSTVERIERVPIGCNGQVVAAYIKNKIAYVYIADWKNVEEGDKMSGRCGNKGIVAHIIPQHLMPFDPETGKSLDIILNPLGVPSRCNISQILEIALGMSAVNKHQLYVVSPFLEGTTNFIENLDEAKPRTLIDGRTGKPFYRPMAVGYIYMLLLYHKVSHKINAVGDVKDRNPVTDMPVKGKKRNGGQTFGEMELWCLLAYGANTILQEFSSLQSTDYKAYRSYLNILAEDPFSVYEDIPKEMLTSSRSIKFTNNNDRLLRGYLRSMGVELVTDASEGTIMYRPLTDSIMQSFTDREISSFQQASLRQRDIFSPKNQANIDSKDIWSCVKLECEIIHPIWILKSNLLSFFTVSIINEKNNRTEIKTKPLTYSIAKKIIDSDLCIRKSTIKEGCIPEISPIGTTSDDTISGIEALVLLFKTYSVSSLLEIKENLDTSQPSKKEEYETLASMKAHIEENICLSDYVISYYPIMPLDFRVEVNIPTVKVDFDEYYKTLLRAITNSRSQSVRGKEVYNCILNFTGIKNNSSVAWSTISRYFLGSHAESKVHGVLRDSLLSKVLKHSGRSTITPCMNTNMKPTEVGVPISMAISIWGPHLKSYMKWLLKKGRFRELSDCGLKLDDKLNWEYILELVVNNNISKLSKLLDTVTNLAKEFRTIVLQEIHTYIEGGYKYGEGASIPRKVVLYGRQPSLHKLSVRAYYVKLVDTLSIQIHPLVCNAYNADFDGDQMWLAAMLTYDSTQEAIEKLMATSTLVNPKDSSLSLVHSQDIKLGVYFATMLKDNVIDSTSSSFYFENGNLKYHQYYDIDTIKYHVEIGVLNLHSFVLYSTNINGDPVHYLSTAGRLLFNNLFPDGFTRLPWSNPLKLPVDLKNIKDLKYDGLIAGNTSHPVIHMIKLESITKELLSSRLKPEGIIDLYQDIMVFGLFYSDMSGISYTLKDLENPAKEDTERILNITEKYRKKIDFDFDSGLLDDEGRKSANSTLYSYVADNYRSAYMKNLDRNSNVFIMLDSEARGNAKQLMMAAGIIGKLEKQKGKDLEVPILSNYKDGVSNFQMEMISYSNRTGVASTQNETAESGALTKLAVYLNSGLKVVEEDCHREDKDPQYIKYKLTYGAPTDKVLKFLTNNLEEIKGCPILSVSDTDFLGHLKTINSEFIQLFDLIDSDIFITTVIDNKRVNLVIFKHTSYVYGSKDFNCSIWLIDGIESLYGKVVIRDKNLPDILSKIYSVSTTSDIMSQQAILTPISVIELQRLHIHYIPTTDGLYRLGYSLSDRDKDQLLYRYSIERLPYLDKLNCVTSKTISFIELYGLLEVDIRTLYDCHSHKGCCSKCYGLLLDSNQFPEVGYNVGIISAQAIGEPATQLTLSKFHQGGASGSGTSGLEILKNFLSHGNPGKEEIATDTSINISKAIALLAPYSGYVLLKDSVTSSSVVNIIVLPEDAYKSYILDKDSISISSYASFLVDRDYLDVSNGNYVHKFDPLTIGYRVPPTEDKALDLDGTNIGREVYRNRQIQITDFYWDTFHPNDVAVHARHFEVSSVLQSRLVLITASNDPDFKVGELYEFSEVIDKDVTYIHSVQRSRNVIKHFSGGSTLLTYNNVNSNLGFMVVSRNVEKVKYSSQLGELLAGVDVSTNEIKTTSRILTPKQPVSSSNTFTPKNVSNTVLCNFFSSFNVQTEQVEVGASDDLLDFIYDTDDVVYVDDDFESQDILNEDDTDASFTAIESNVFQSNIFNK